MTEIEIKTIFNNIEAYNLSELREMVVNDFRVSLCSSSPNGEPCSLIGLSDKEIKEPIDVSLKICQDAWTINIRRITNIIHDNPKTSKSILEIVLLLAPALAQQYSGLSGYAVVGIATIFCKQRLGL